MRNKKRNRVFLLLILLLAISIGFAILSTTLKINGTAGIGKNIWKIYWDNVNDVVKSEGAVLAQNGGAAVDPTDNTLVSFNVTLNQPGDFYEFQVDAVNAGTLDAMVEVVPTATISGDDTTLPDYLIYTVKYADGLDIEQYDLLPKAVDLDSTPKVYSTQRYKVRLEFSKDVDDEDLEEIETKNSYTINLRIPYIQADSRKKVVPTTPNFGDPNQPISNIIAAYERGITAPLEEAMQNGTTREVGLDLDHNGTYEITGHLRIANLSRLADCDTQGFTQSACGLVLEFVEGIEQRTYNPYPNPDLDLGIGTKGGWEYSDMRAYLNGSTSPADRFEALDYRGTGFFDALPEEYRNAIITTEVVTGIGASDSINTTTQDKIYLASAHEIWKDHKEGQTPPNVIDYRDTAYYNVSRQLDYYLYKGVTTKYSPAEYGPAAKKNLNGDSIGLWLRTPCNVNSTAVFDVLSSGDWGDTSVNDSSVYISPMFRLSDGK